MPKTPEEIAADESANKEQREQLAREANKKRNDAMLEQRNAIADSADQIKDEEDDLVDLTDEAWDQEDRPDQVTRKSRAQRLADQEALEEEEGLTEEEAAARLIREKEAEEDELDEAREAGADDSRKNEDGEVEYRVEVAGEVKWLTLAALRESVGQGRGPAGDGQGARKGVTTPATQVPTPEQREAQRLADEQRRKDEKAARKAKFKDLQLRASMGDEEAIDELADIQADSSRVTPEELERMVDQRVDARVVGKTAFDQAVAWFESKDGYARELAAPGFKLKAAAIDKRLFDEHPDWSPRQRLDATGKELRKELTELQKFLGVKPGTLPARKRDEPPSRLERKRQASDEVPRASGRARSDTEPDEVQTSKDAIQQLARGRGQARPISH
jgi:hypothetical protein